MGLRIIVIIGWISFFIYDLYLIRLLGNEYNKDPSNFVFFEDDQQRQAYKTTIPYLNSDWIEEASLVAECKPMIYFKDFYFQRIDPFVKLSIILIILTLVLRVSPSEWKDMGKKIEKLSEKIEDDADNK